MYAASDIDILNCNAAAAVSSLFVLEYSVNILL